MAERWQDHPLFRGLSEEALAAFRAAGRSRTLRAGELLFREGDPADALYVVTAGHLEVVKEGGRSAALLRRVGVGGVLGEVALADAAPRSATVRAIDEATVLGVAMTLLRSAADPASAEPGLHALSIGLVQNLAESLAGRMRERDVDALAAAEERLVVGRLILYVLVLLTIYLFVVSLMPALRGLSSTGTSVITFPLVLLFAGGTLYFIRASGRPLAEFGLTLRGGGRAALEGAVVAVPLVLALIGAKAAWIAAHAELAGRPIFEAGAIAARYSLAAYAFTLGVYVAFTALQELIARGLQTALARYLHGPRADRWALVLSALLFAAMHVHVSPGLALAAFAPGLLWGWLYARQRTLVGVTVSHALVGAFVYFVLDAKIPG